MCKSNKKVDEKTTFKISAGILVYQDKKVIISKLKEGKVQSWHVTPEPEVGGG